MKKNDNKRIFVLVLLIVLVLIVFKPFGLGALVPPEELRDMVVADSYVKESDPDMNFGFG